MKTATLLEPTSQGTLAEKQGSAPRQLPASHWPIRPVHVTPIPALQRQEHCACGGDCPRCQRTLPVQMKLSISQPGDVYEQEADRVAEQVMRMPEPKLLRACAPCAAGGAPCPKCAAEEEDLVQRKTASLSASAQNGSVQEEFLADLGAGAPLDDATRGFMESRFGYDFSQVRVHADEKAARSTEAVNALAYTVGSSVVFGAGQYAPSTDAGRRLIAHELTHFIQQGGSASRLSTVTLQRYEAPIGSRDPRSLDDLELAEEYRRVLAASDPDTESYLLALEAEVRRRAAAAGAGEQSTPARPAPGGTQSAPDVPTPLLGLLARPEAEALAPTVTSAAEGTAAVAEGTAAIEGTAAVEGAVVAEEATAGATAARIGLGAAAFWGFVLTLPFWLQGDTPVPRLEPKQPEPQQQPRPVPETQPRPRPQPRPRDPREEECRRLHPNALTCEEPIDLEEVVMDYLIMQENIDFLDILDTDCYLVDHFGPNEIDACSGAPGERWHCDVTIKRRGSRTVLTVSVFGCTCCNQDGSTGKEWMGAHLSVNMSRRGGG